MRLAPCNRGCNRGDGAAAFAVFLVSGLSRTVTADFNNSLMRAAFYSLL